MRAPGRPLCSRAHGYSEVSQVDLARDKQAANSPTHTIPDTGQHPSQLVMSLPLYMHMYLVRYSHSVTCMQALCTHAYMLHFKNYIWAPLGHLVGQPRPVWPAAKTVSSPPRRETPLWPKCVKRKHIHGMLPRNVVGGLGTVLMVRKYTGRETQRCTCTRTCIGEKSNCDYIHNYNNIMIISYPLTSFQLVACAYFLQVC